MKNKNNLLAVLVTIILLLISYNQIKGQECGTHVPVEESIPELGKGDIAIEKHKRLFTLNSKKAYKGKLHVTHWYVDDWMRFEFVSGKKRRFYIKSSGEGNIKIKAFEEDVMNVSVWNPDLGKWENKLSYKPFTRDLTRDNRKSVLEAYSAIKPFRGAVWPRYVDRLVDFGRNEVVDTVLITYKLEPGIGNDRISEKEVERTVEEYIEFFGGIWGEQTGDVVVVGRVYHSNPDIDITNEYKENNYLAYTYTLNKIQKIVFNTKYKFGPVGNDVYSFMWVYAHEMSHLGQNQDHGEFELDVLMRASVGKKMEFMWEDPVEMKYLRAATYWLLNR